METKFTKGGWKSVTTPEYHNPKSSTLEIHSDESGGWICKVQNNGVIGEQEGTANGKLIVAAPEMFEALKSIYDDPETFNDLFVSQQDKIKSALKKATE